VSFDSCMDQLRQRDAEEKEGNSRTCKQEEKRGKGGGKPMEEGRHAEKGEQTRDEGRKEDAPQGIE